MTTIRSCQRRTSIDCPTLERWCLLIEIRWPYAHIRMCPVPLSTLLHASDLYAGHKEPENVNRLWLIGRHKMQGADDRNRQQEGKKKKNSLETICVFRLYGAMTHFVREKMADPTFPANFHVVLQHAVCSWIPTGNSGPISIWVGGSWFLMAQTIAKSPTSVAIEPAPASGRFYTTGWCTNTRRQPPTRKHDATDTLMCV